MNEQISEAIRLRSLLEAGVTMESVTVTCDETNNSQESIKQGYLRADITIVLNPLTKPDSTP